MNPRHFTSRSTLLATALAFGPVFSTTAAAQGMWLGNSDAKVGTVANWDVLPASGIAWTFQAAGTSGLALNNGPSPAPPFPQHQPRPNLP